LKGLAAALLQPPIVHGEALYQILAQARRRPLPELSAAMTAHAVAHGENGLQPVMAELSRDLAFSLDANL